MEMTTRELIDIFNHVTKDSAKHKPLNAKTYKESKQKLIDKVKTVLGVVDITPDMVAKIKEEMKVHRVPPAVAKGA